MQTQTTNGRVLADLTQAFSKPSAPAQAAKAELPWQTLDVASLSPDLQDQYYAYKAAEEIATKVRKTFEAAMSIKLDLPPGVILRFGYRFGKLSVALDVDQRSKSKTNHLSLEGLARMVDRKNVK